MRYKKKPITVEAMRFTIAAFREENEELMQFLKDAKWIQMPSGSIQIVTLEGDMNVSDGDWIIKGVKSEFYPCKADIFSETYECADSPPSVRGLVKVRDRIRLEIEKRSPAQTQVTEAYVDAFNIALGHVERELMRDGKQ